MTEELTAREKLEQAILMYQHILALTDKELQLVQVTKVAPIPRNIFQALLLKSQDELEKLPE